MFPFVLSEIKMKPFRVKMISPTWTYPRSKLLQDEIDFSRGASSFLSQCPRDKWNTAFNVHLFASYRFQRLSLSGRRVVVESPENVNSCYENAFFLASVVLFEPCPLCWSRVTRSPMLVTLITARQGAVYRGSKNHRRNLGNRVDFQAFIVTNNR